MSLLHLEQHGATLLATVNRPEAHNAINFEVMEALEETLDRLERDNTIRAFVLRGAGRQAFIAGGDLKEFHTIKTADEAKPMARRMLDIYERLEELPCWTIASINGDAYGGGWETMLAFDFRIAAETASFGFTQGKFYLPPGWGGLTRLVERVGRSTALIWLAEAAVIDCKMALKHGLVDKSASPEALEQETMNWAEKMIKNDRAFIGNLKRGAMHLTEARWKAIEAELEPFTGFWEDDRHQERVEKFLERNK